MNLSIKKIISFSVAIGFFTSPQLCMSQSDIVDESYRPLTELNKDDNSEAYPFISDDGLRIYFTSGPFESSNIFVASREDASSSFSEAVLLSENFPPGSHSSWLAKDELEIYFIHANQVYTSRRVHVSEKFPKPVPVKLSGTFSDFLSSVSVTPDKNELLTYSVSNKETNILTFKRKESTSDVYELSGTLSIPEGLKAGSGRLSSNGLEFYMSVGLSNSHKLAKLTRSSLTHSLSDFQFVNHEVIAGLGNTIQPAGASDSFFAFVVNGSVMWNDNDLYLYQRTQSTLHEGQSYIPYPNPTTGIVYIQLPEFADKTSMKITSMEGTELKHVSFSIDNDQVKIDASELEHGIYIFTIGLPDKVISRKIVKVSR